MGTASCMPAASWSIGPGHDIGLSARRDAWFWQFTKSRRNLSLATEAQFLENGMDSILLAVNGTLMRGLELNPNLLAVGATFVREAATEACYRLWSIDDGYPAMIRSPKGGAAVAVEVWSVPPAGLAAILLREPPGLSIGKVKLADGSTMLGVIAEPIACEGQEEITRFGGWRAYIKSK